VKLEGKAARGTTPAISLARALAPKKVRVNAVAPRLLARGSGAGFISDGMLEAVATSTAAGRPATVEECAQAVLHLVTNGSMTDSTTIVDLGLTALGPRDR
jgi:NAD(P)-dependent dehydrogenase (short-subunit alcohol dehydrogenase family)